MSKLQRRVDEVTAIDFFQAPEQGTAEILLEDLVAQASGEAPAPTASREGFENLRGKAWVTRENIFVDRIACGWLIQRFVDSEAVNPHKNYLDNEGENL